MICFALYKAKGGCLYLRGIRMGVGNLWLLGMMCEWILDVGLWVWRGM